MEVSSEFLLIVLAPALGVLVIIVVIELGAVFWGFARETIDSIRGGL